MPIKVVSAPPTDVPPITLEFSGDDLRVLKELTGWSISIPKMIAEVGFKDSSLSSRAVRDSLQRLLGVLTAYGR